MKKLLKFIQTFLIVAVSALAIFMILNLVVKTPRFQRSTGSKVSVVKKVVKKQVTLTAIGDSLTYGVGDATKNGGYVPLIKKELELQDGNQVTTHNFGVSGDTSTQIRTRILKQRKVQDGLANADLITMTVGANDLMHELRNNINNVSVAKIKTASKTYQQNLTKLIKTIRQHNAKAPIVIASIYDPFYVYFPQLTDLQTGMAWWNTTTQNTIKQFTDVYYVDIDSVMTKPKGSILANNKQKQATVNPYLYTKDHFHPNNRGYQAIANQLVTKIQAIKTQWLYQK
ncbi:SGNH/GDSL hydrolase family protein [Lapidilactobacillus bayanensis]|uniref:SGNH/GDSL hydrolase family protein n=1 Tax=Lapidilactobacillus bayanensis TaxID=2485998 RepID=UPI000F780D92|nr:SGNH/GDSL hydrolase family protein [Lapidilactobacillus bayanensis]